MRKHYRQKLLPILFAAMLMLTLFLPMFSASAVNFTITITLSSAGHGSKMPVNVKVNTDPDTQAFSRFVVVVSQSGNQIGSLSWQDEDGRDVIAASISFPEANSPITVQNTMPSSQVLTFSCTVYNASGAVVASGSASKEPPITHSYVNISPSPASCTEPGYNNQRCSICGFISRTVISDEPALSHSLLGSYIHDDTTSGGQSKHYRQCVRSGCSHKEMDSCQFTKPFIMPASCIAAEQRSFTCSDCRYHYTAQSGNPLGHDFERDAARDTAATCTAAGLEGWTCSRTGCGVHDDKTVNALGHDFRRDAARDIAATCTAAGLEAWTCSRIGCSSYDDKTVNTLGHDFRRDAARDTAATCTASGVEAWTCSRAGCGVHDDKTVNALGHDFRRDAARDTAATCTASGLEAWTCSRAGCGAYDDKAVNALGHDFERDAVRDTAATCTAAGLEAWNCSRTGCGVHDDKTVNALGHNFERDAARDTAATCTAAGLEAWTCSRAGCGTYDDKAVNALGHDFERDAARDTAATCTAAGLEAWTCSRAGCGAYDDKAVNALGHDFERDAARDTAATCTAAGLEAWNCSRTGCGVHDDKTVNALGHNFERDAARDTAATCTAAGLEAWTCSACADKRDIGIIALGHEYFSIVTKPTCTERGFTTSTCARCGHAYTVDNAARLSHWYGEWISMENGTHTANCMRPGCAYELTRKCSPQGYQLGGDQIEVCPICGETSAGVCLGLLGGTEASADATALPHGELVARSGILPDGTKLISLAFEIAAEMQTPSGRINFTLPAGQFKGHSFKLMKPDGSMIDIPVMINGNRLSFILDFTSSTGMMTDMPVLIQVIPTDVQPAV